MTILGKELLAKIEAADAVGDYDELRLLLLVAKRKMRNFERQINDDEEYLPTSQRAG